MYTTTSALCCSQNKPASTTSLSPSSPHRPSAVCAGVSSLSFLSLHSLHDPWSPCFLLSDLPPPPPHIQLFAPLVSVSPHDAQTLSYPRLCSLANPPFPLSFSVSETRKISNTAFESSHIFSSSLYLKQFERLSLFFHCLNISSCASFILLGLAVIYSF